MTRRMAGSIYLLVHSNCISFFKQMWAYVAKLKTSMIAEKPITSVMENYLEEYRFHWKRLEKCMERTEQFSSNLKQHIGFLKSVS